MTNNAALTLLALALLAGVVWMNQPQQGKEQTAMEDIQTMTLTSTAFENGGRIPVTYSCDHDNISPELKWEGVPVGTKSFALIGDDPDAPAATWTHWLIYNIPPEVRGLPEQVPDKKKLEDGSMQGLNDFRKIGYGGPCPPEGHGPHHYHFKLYALDAMLDLEPGVSREELDAAMKTHTLGFGQIVGLYERGVKKGG